MVTQITPINLIPGTMIPRVNISQYDTGARVLKFLVYNGDAGFTFTSAMTVALVGTKPDGKGFSYTGTIDNNMPTFDVTAQMSAVAGKVRAELIIFENGQRCGSGNFVIFVEEGALGENTDMSDSDYAIINDALEASFDLDHFYADLQNMVAEAVEDIQVKEGQVVIDPTLTIAGAAADAKATGDLARKFLDALMTETVGPAALVATDDAAGGLPVKTLTANLMPNQAAGTPSPDNVLPISGYTGVTVTRTGKNLVEPLSKTESGLTLTPQNDGGLIINGTYSGTTAAWYVISSSFYVVPGVTYMPSIGVNLSDTRIIDYGLAGFGNSRPVTHTAFFRTQLRIRVAAGAVFNNVKLYPMVEVGATATEFEPFVALDSYSIAFPTAAGTVYGGTLIVNSDGSGTLTVTHKLVMLAEQTIARRNTQTTGVYRFAFNPSEHGIKGADKFVVNSNVLKTVDSNGTYLDSARTDYVIGNDANDYWINFYSSTLQTVEAWQAFATEYNVQVVYQLETPTTYALSAVQVAELLQGVNNLWTDAAGTLSAEYYANTALYVEKKIAELQALILEN